MPQFLILGLDGAGKTTLLYRLKLGSQAWPQIKGDMAAMRQPKADVDKEKDNDQEVDKYDAGYHYEELSFRNIFNCGMWDVPGTEPMRRVWRCFYHSIKIHGVVFVVKEDINPGENDVPPERLELARQRIELARQYISLLMNEDELRLAPFAVILNVEEGTKAKVGGKKADEEELFYRLGLHRAPESCRWRLKAFKINVLHLTGESDKAFEEVMKHMKSCLSNPRSYGMNF